MTEIYSKFDQSLKELENDKFRTDMRILKMEVFIVKLVKASLRRCAIAEREKELHILIEELKSRRSIYGSEIPDAKVF